MSDAADALNPNKNGFNQAMDPNKNGLAESARNTSQAIANWNVMGGGVPSPFSVLLDLTRRGLDMGDVRMGGSNRRASEAMPTMGGMRRLSGR
jgi:hypothetical protein